MCIHKSETTSAFVDNCELQLRPASSRELDDTASMAMQWPSNTQSCSRSSGTFDACCVFLYNYARQLLDPEKTLDTGTEW